jgi:DNA-binding NtrC family response regulator
MEELLPPRTAWAAFKPALISMAKTGVPLRESLDMFAKAYVKAALEVTNGNQVRAGRMLQTHRNTIARWGNMK